MSKEQNIICFIPKLLEGSKKVDPKKGDNHREEVITLAQAILRSRRYRREEPSFMKQAITTSTREQTGGQNRVNNSGPDSAA